MLVAKILATKFGFVPDCLVDNKIADPTAVWYKTKFGSQNFGYQFWCLFVIYIMF